MIGARSRAFGWRVFRLAIVGLVGLAIGCTAPPEPPAVGTSSAVAVAAGRLEPGYEEALSLPMDTARAYRVALTAGDALVVTLDQRGVDVGATVTSPAGTLALEVDSPTDDTGPELLCYVARETGQHRIVLSPFRARPDGELTLRVASLGPATAADRACEDGVRGLVVAMAAPQDRVRSEYQAAAAHFADAGRPAQQAVALFEACAAGETTLAIDDAIACYERAAAVADAGGEAARAIARDIRLRIGLRHLRAHRRGAAETVFGRELARALATGDEEGAAFARGNLGLAEQARGEHFRAIDAFEAARRHWESVGHRAHARQQIINHANALTELGLFDEALDELDEADALAAGDDERAAVAVVRGWTHHLARRPALAVETLAQATATFRASGSAEPLSGALDRLGTAYLVAGDLDAAAAAYQESLTIATDRGDAGRVATLINCAWLLLRRGDAGLAGWLFERLREGSPFESPLEAEPEAHVRTGLGLLALRAGQPRVAAGHFEAAVAIYEDVRAIGRRDGQVQTPVAVWQDTYALATEAYRASARGSAEPETEAALARALVAADRSRAKILVEMLGQARVDLRAGVDEGLLRAEVAAEDDLQQAQEHGDEAGIRAAERNLRAARAAIRAAHPRFAEVRDPTPLDVGALRATLGPDRQMLVYHLGEARSTALVVGAEGIVAVDLAPRAELEARAAEMAEAWRLSGVSPSQGQAELSGRLLARALLAEVLPHLRAPRLVVVPEGHLAYVPFGALPAGPGDARLGDRFEVSHVASASAWMALQGRPAAPLVGARVLVIADPVTAGADPRLPAVAAGAPPRAMGLPPLPGTADEARAVLAAAGGRGELLEGFAATVDALRGRDLEPYGIVHLAAHAEIDEALPARSAIVLSGWDEGGRRIEQDRLLPSHVYRLRLGAGLVTLSGCETGGGRPVVGEGLVGFTQSFFGAGARRLLVSLWPVGDGATAQLMRHVYQGLLDEGRTPADALRRAQAALRADPATATPYHWAGFIVLGGE